MSSPAADAPAVARCPHCGVAIDGPVDAFCCHGCEVAASIISGAGLGAYYQRREAPAPRPELVRADWSAVPVEAGDDGSQSCRLAIDGLQCASCVWVVENVLQRTPGVKRATVSYATGRATVSWDPQATSLPALGARIAALGYRPRPVDAPSTGDRELLTRLGVSVFSAMNIMLLAATIYAGWFDGMEERYAALFRWVSLALATPVALWSAEPFYRSAWTALKAGVVHMDLPIGVAVAGLYVHGLAATIVGVDGYLDSLSMLVTLLLAGRVVEARGRRHAAAAASAIAAGLPSAARRAVGDSIETVSVEDLALGDVVEVGLGEEVPVDGVVVRGRARVGLALLTGESEPARIEVGDWVVAGAPVVDGTLAVRVERVGTDTLGRRMAAEVLASVDRPLLPTPADRLAPAFTVVALVAASATLVGWTWAAGLGAGIERMAAVLVVACPCALGLSWPVTVSAGLGALARRGVVLRSGDALQRLAAVDVVALDKTGTVTGGTPEVVAADDDVLRIAAALERASAHPVASAIRRAAVRRGIPLPIAEGVVEEPGIGVSGWFDGARWSLRSGGPGEVLLRREDGGSTETSGAPPAPPVWRIVLRDVPRDDAASAVAGLKGQARVAMLTGDHPDVAERLAALIGPDEWHARATPEDKAQWIAGRQAEGRRVLFVGDGLNDGPALVRADVGLAMRGGVAASVLAADGVVVGDGLASIGAALRVARVVRATVRANLARSLVYNAVAVSAAAAGYVDPLVAALLMPASSLLVLWGGVRVEARTRREERWTSS